jgi:hypothetical protein
MKVSGVAIAAVKGEDGEASGGTGLSVGAVLGILLRADLFLVVTVGLGRFLSAPSFAWL